MLIFSILQIPYISILQNPLKNKVWREWLTHPNQTFVISQYFRNAGNRMYQAVLPVAIPNNVWLLKQNCD